MQPRIAHVATDQDKHRWKAVALFALIAVWLVSGIFGREPWKPDEPIYIGILQSMLQDGGRAWWSTTVAGQLVNGESALIHWLDTPIILFCQWLFPTLQLHEAARLTSVVWAALGIAAIALTARRWSNGHVSYLAAIIAIGCIGLYDRAHSYAPDIALFTALALALYGCAELPHALRRATALLISSLVIAFAARSVLGFAVIALPLVGLCFAPVFSMHRVVLVRVLVIAALVCGCWIFMHSVRDPIGFKVWVDTHFGLTLQGRTRFGPTFYLTTLLWFAWPAWPIAIWLLTLRGRGFNGGWQRGEVIAPAAFFIGAYVVIGLFSDARTVYALYLLPPLILLASFGVDTLRRTWYALIDWFGILMLGLASVFVVFVTSAIFFDWPAPMARWIDRFVPGYDGKLPWYAYVFTLLAFAIWLALIQPAHKHARRALINWAGCVTLLWVVSHALLLQPANHVTSYKDTFNVLGVAWPKDGCVNSLGMPPNYAALLRYHSGKVAQPVDTINASSCPYLLVQRYRGQPEAPPGNEYQLLARANRPRDRHEAFELYAKKTQP